MLTLPSGRTVRGRGLRAGLPPAPLPELSVVLSATRPRPLPWDVRWLRWPDFGLPSDPAEARAALQEAWRRAAAERVEVACRGGRGRTGTALACLLVLDGWPAAEAVPYVRAHYDRRAAETSRQRHYVVDFG